MRRRAEGLREEERSLQRCSPRRRDSRGVIAGEGRNWDQIDLAVVDGESDEEPLICAVAPRVRDDGGQRDEVAVLRIGGLDFEMPDDEIGEGKSWLDAH